jgi:hypothetical protein
LASRARRTPWCFCSRLLTLHPAAEISPRPCCRFYLICTPTYGERDPELGLRLVAAVEKCLERLSKLPEKAPVVPWRHSNVIRRVVVVGFPYSIFSATTGDEIGLRSGRKGKPHLIRHVCEVEPSAVKQFLMFAKLTTTMKWPGGQAQSFAPQQQFHHLLITDLANTL